MDAIIYTTNTGSGERLGTCKKRGWLCKAHLLYG